ncbi:hypothetical protein M0813_27917 [Anaeramoeba flamelloides]|uniref:Uncharacterized protein n=1 Tax=Anaeramoeba flamelloides TaxID=1746091 RepID=A0ABQ8XV93_9EUKA|nr:hypothetical protein M0813_27917 [Anaeramoeba flamelloides]
MSTNKPKTSEQKKKKTDNQIDTSEGNLTLIKNFLFKEFSNNKNDQKDPLFTEEQRQEISNDRKSIHNFFRVPYNFETSIFYGIVLVLDIFFHYLVIFPMKTIISIFKKIMKQGELTVEQKVNIILLTIWIVVIFVLKHINLYSMLSGIHKSQIKLMFLYNGLEVLDGVFTTFTQQTIDSLYVTVLESSKANGTKNMLSVAIDSLIAFFVILIHTTILFTSVVMIGISMTSKKLSMLPFLLSNNWIEFKQSILKKQNLKSMRNIFRDDCFERVKLYIFAFSVVTEDLASTEFDIEVERKNTLKWLIIAEFIVDWGKNAFVVKNNDYSPKIFKSFRNRLAALAWISHEQEDQCQYIDLIQRKMGFVMIPLTLLFFKVSIGNIWKNFPIKVAFLITCLLYLLFLIFYLAIKIFNLHLAQKYYKIFQSEKANKNVEKKND